MSVEPFLEFNKAIKEKNTMGGIDEKPKLYPCKKCKGDGWYYIQDQNGKPVKVICNRCEGSGSEEYPRKDLQ